MGEVVLLRHLVPAHAGGNGGGRDVEQRAGAQGLGSALGEGTTEMIHARIPFLGSAVYSPEAFSVEPGQAFGRDHDVAGRVSRLPNGRHRADA